MAVSFNTVTWCTRVHACGHDRPAAIRLRVPPFQIAKTHAGKMQSYCKGKEESGLTAPHVRGTRSEVAISVPRSVGHLCFFGGDIAGPLILQDPMDPNPTKPAQRHAAAMRTDYIFHFGMSDGKTQPQLRAIEPAPYAVFFAPSGPESEGFLVPVRVFCTWS